MKAFIRTLGLAAPVLLVGCGTQSAPTTTAAEDLGQTKEALANAVPLFGQDLPGAAFLTIQGPGGPFFCSGTLVGDREVLTAAHCVVCKTSVTVQFMAPAPGQVLPGLPGPFLSVATSPDALVANPGAFSGDPCTTNPMEGADVAIVHLDAPVDPAVARATVLLIPPYGFSPVQDLFGPGKVTLVGRGQTALDQPGIGVMRQGLASLDHYTNAQGGTSCGVSVNVPFSLGLDNAPGEAQIMHGDSGGPMLAIVSGKSQIIGVGSLVISAGDVAVGGVYAPTFTTVNANFLRQQLDPGAGPQADGDGDSVPDSQDNCPFDANTDQIDRDTDGVGDVCDNCAPPIDVEKYPLTSYDGSGVDPAFFNPDQANCNDEAENQLILNLPGGFVDPLTGMVRRATYSDYTAVLGPFSPASCDDGLIGQTKFYRRGDACDPAPCARTAIQMTPADPVDVGGSFGCLSDDHLLFGTCEWTVPGSVEFTPIRNVVGKTGENALRYCKCALPHGTEAERRANCGVGTLANCGVGATHFKAPGVDPTWLTMSLSLTDQPKPPAKTAVDDEAVRPTTQFGPDGIEPAGQVGWDSVSDLAGLTGISLPPKPWTIQDDGTLKGGPVLRGVLWSHVPKYDGQSTGIVEDQDSRGFLSGLASHYRSADHAFLIEFHKKALLETRPPWPWAFCAECNFGLDMPWLTAVTIGSPAHVISVSPTRTVDVTHAVTDVAKGLLASNATRVLASEPEYRLIQAGISRRELALDPATLSVVGSLSVIGDQVVGGGVRVTGQARTPNGLENANAVFSAAVKTGNVAQLSDLALAYSGVRDEVYALVRGPGDAEAALARWSTAVPSWTAVTLHGANIHRPLAMAFSLEDDALYVLEQPTDGAGAHTELARIRLSGQVDVLESKLLNGKYDHVSLTMGYRGDLLLGVSRQAPRTTQLAHLEVKGDTVAVVSRYEGKGDGLDQPGGKLPAKSNGKALNEDGEVLASLACENSHGVGFLVESGTGFAPVFVNSKQFVASGPDACANPVFP